MKNKSLVFVLISALLLSCICGCGKSNNSGDKLNIVTTIFAPYDFAREVTGDLADVTMLLKPGAETHSYEPTIQDIVKIQNCDVFIYIGGESEDWVTDILDSIGGENTVIVKLMDYVDVYEEEFKEGMDTGSDEDVPSETGDNEDEETEYDEHIWTSPKNAIKLVEAVKSAVCSADSENEAAYEANAAEYISKLEELDASFENVVASGSTKTIVFGDRFPLLYFAKEYGLDYYAAFQGCSSDTEASAATVAFLIDKVNAENIPVVFHIELSNENISGTISETTGAVDLLFYTCHNVTNDDFTNGETYLSLMTKNVESLAQALGSK